MKKRIYGLLLATTMAVTSLAGCGDRGAQTVCVETTRKEEALHQVLQDKVTTLSRFRSPQTMQGIPLHLTTVGSPKPSALQTMAIITITNTQSPLPEKLMTLSQKADSLTHYTLLFPLSPQTLIPQVMPTCEDSSKQVTAFTILIT